MTFVNGTSATAQNPQVALPAPSVKPNPTPNGYLQLQVSEANATGLYDLEELNLLGARLLARQIRLGVSTPAPLDLAALPPGLYLGRFANG